MWKSFIKNIGLGYDLEARYSPSTVPVGRRIKVNLLVSLLVYDLHD